jgi:hypothetical protein
VHLKVGNRDFAETIDRSLYLNGILKRKHRNAALAATKTAPQRAQRTQRIFFVRFVPSVVKKIFAVVIVFEE